MESGVKGEIENTKKYGERTLKYAKRAVFFPWQKQQMSQWTFAQSHSLGSHTPLEATPKNEFKTKQTL